MARNARTLLSPYQAEAMAIAELARIGVRGGLSTRWKRKRQQDGVDMGYARPYRKHGKLRKGQHRGHLCSRTSRSGKKKA